MTWRKSWERNWDQVRHCSNGCRKRRVSDVDKALEAAVLELLDARARDASICPSEVARLVAGEQWQEAMEPTRRAARRLVAEGLVVITQKGQVVDPSTAKGPIRIRRIRP
jgi:hypothetical protein